MQSNLFRFTNACAQCSCVVAIKKKTLITEFIRAAHAQSKSDLMEYSRFHALLNCSRFAIARMHVELYRVVNDRRVRTTSAKIKNYPISHGMK